MNSTELENKLDDLFEEDRYKELIDTIESLSELDYGMTMRLIRAYCCYADESEDVESCFNRAIGLLETIRQEGADDPNWYYSMGNSLYHTGRESEAVPYLERLVDMLKDEGKDGADEFLERLQNKLEECRWIRDFLENPAEQPLAYYESRSYMIAVLRPEQESWVNEPGLFIHRLKSFGDIKVLRHKADLNNEEGPDFVIDYKGETYEVDLFPTDVYKEQKESLCRGILTEEEQELLNRAQIGIVLAMPYGKDTLQSFHLQLKLLDALVPDLLAVIDESGEQVFPGRWVRQVARQQTPPAPEMLFYTQAVGNGKSVWMHTHGLARTGNPELEILDVNEESCRKESEVIKTVARTLLCSNEPFQMGEPIFTAYLSGKQYLICTMIAWPEAVSLYPDDICGSVKERKDGHNTHSAALFVYPDKESCNERKFYPLSIYDDCLDDNPVFYIPQKETERMKALALEHIGRLKDYVNTHPDSDVILKLGLDVDEWHKEESSSDKEHLWFALKHFIDDEHFEAELTNEPYYIDGLKNGSVGVYSIKQITDWEIYLPDCTVTPDSVYLLDIF